MDGLGVYIQVPFCASKCSFCNFSSRVSRSDVFDDYTRAIEKESERLPEIFASRGIGLNLLGLPVDTLYMGGGTPSLLGAGRIRRIVEALRRRLRFSAALEFTLEVTPGSGDDGFLLEARRLGVNRLSIGAQSFDDRELRTVGRLHTADETRDLVRRARRAGLAEINLDLIAGLPHQTESSWRGSLQSATDSRPTHISVYLFEVDEKSRLGAEVMRHGIRYHAGAVPNEDFMASAYEAAREFLAEAGYTQYEISNFCLPGHESRHNRKYWRLEPYLGLGAGAHSFDGRARWANVSEPDVYLERLRSADSPLAEFHSLACREQMEEFFILGLRQRAGVDLGVARREWGEAAVRDWEPRIDSLTDAGWLERSGDKIRLPERAYLVSNEIFQEFL